MGFLKHLIDNVHEKKMAKVEAKKDKTQEKFQTQAIAYQNGIDPKAAVAGMVGSLGTSAAGALGSIFGAKSGGALGGLFGGAGATSGTSSKGPLIIGVLIAVVVFLYSVFHRKKR